MVRVGIVGATGYAGEELIGILLRHSQVRITSVSAKIDKPEGIEKIFPKFKNKISLVCKEPDIKEIVAECDLVFLALPHTVSMEIAPKLLGAGKKVIDLSADYRLKNTATYTQFYKAKHKDKVSLVKAVYGLPELYRAKIKNAQLIANPGCYPTAAILSLAPLVAFNLADSGSIIIDAKSGVTGAGKKVAESFLFSEINGDFKAYKVNVHQHMPEINQELSKLAAKGIKVIFVPHLLPLNRGILETIYVKKGQRAKGKGQKLISLYKKFYKKEPFVRIKDEGDFPRIKDVVGTNFCDIGIKESADSIIIISAIDNLLKGASGQAVQNMNIMYKFPEYSALI
ncbi:MAG: N-acetyl-gamma-glutamyl-phosphate reductase [Candidatus Omnitrophica bacterium]|nr:N-acetyl-gamma-glutamyl-phosphate reductase [Candidatus Omnitrophota bacterium]MDD5592839.1 N-acetyl-gamma-glutamyl-phosphate reductase [Candidatus Omnitrophota bacterium]